jgi:hypothetical protein
LSDDTSNFVYEAVKPLDRSSTYKLLLSDDVGAIVRAILTISWHDDWRFAQDVCLKFARHDTPDVSRISIVGLAHIARVHRMIDLDSVLRLATEIRTSGKHLGELADLLDDIAIYVTRGHREG